MAEPLPAAAFGEQLGGAAALVGEVAAGAVESAKRPYSYLQALAENAVEQQH